LDKRRVKETQLGSGKREAGKKLFNIDSIILFFSVNIAVMD